MSRHHVKLNAARWQRVRRVVLDRDGWRCQSTLPNGEKCLRPGRLEVDHVVALHLGGAAWELANLQTLCRGCHIDKTTVENGGAAIGVERTEWMCYNRGLDTIRIKDFDRTEAR